MPTPADSAQGPLHVRATHTKNATSSFLLYQQGESRAARQDWRLLSRKDRQAQFNKVPTEDKELRPPAPHTHTHLILQQRIHLRQNLTSCCNIQHLSLLWKCPAQVSGWFPCSGDSADPLIGNQHEQLTRRHLIKCITRCVSFPRKLAKPTNAHSATNSYLPKRPGQKHWQDRLERWRGQKEAGRRPTERWDVFNTTLYRSSPRFNQHLPGYTAKHQR